MFVECLFSCSEIRCRMCVSLEHLVAVKVFLITDTAAALRSPLLDILGNVLKWGVLDVFCYSLVKHVC